jgi:hypothetical protein
MFLYFSLSLAPRFSGVTLGRRGNNRFNGFAMTRVETVKMVSPGFVFSHPTKAKVRG